MSSDVLSNICEMRRENCAPHECNSKVYVGLEHIDSGRFRLSRHGVPSEVRSAKSRFYPGDVLYGKLRPYLDKAVVAETEGICSTDILVLEPLEAPSWFLCGVLHTNPFIEHAKQTTHGVNHPRTSWPGIKMFESLYLSPPEQKKIAAVLFKIQRAIETQEKIIQSLSDLKKSTMQHLFTHGLRGEKTKMTEIGEIPKSWEVYPLSELREFLQYGTSKRCTLDRKGVPVLRIPNIVGGNIDTQELKYADLPSAERERLFLQDGDILFVRTNGQKILVGRTAVYTGNPSPALFASYLIRARLQLKLIRPDFLQYYTGTASGESHLSGRATPAADGKFNINTRTIDSVLVPVPDLREQDKIVRTIDLVGRKLVVHESKKSAFQDLFKTTLNKLMTGDIRVGNLDIDVSEVKI